MVRIVKAYKSTMVILSPIVIAWSHPYFVTVGPYFFASYVGNQAIKEYPKWFKVVCGITCLHIAKYLG
jgi:hypothetical protein